MCTQGLPTRVNGLVFVFVAAKFQLCRYGGRGAICQILNNGGLTQLVSCIIYNNVKFSIISSLSDGWKSRSHRVGG